MRVCIDGLGISKLKGTGLYTYSFELISHLSRFYPQPQYHLIWEGDMQGLDGFDNKKLIYSDIALNRKANDYTTLEEYLVKNKIDLYHSPNNGMSIPDQKVCKYVITVHDLLPLYEKNLVDTKYLKKFTNRFPRAVEQADKIIVVSEVIKSELMEHFNVPEKRIEMVYPGCSNIFKPIAVEECEEVLQNKYNIAGKFLLHAGSIHPRKNLGILLEVFSQVLKFEDTLKLVIVGKYDSKREEYYLYLRDLAKKLGIQESIIFTGIVDYTDMPLFYNSTLCALNLSEYEGFPISTVEAIACNAPVICSKHAVFEEVIGSAGILVNPEDTELVEEIILSIVSNSNYKSLVSKKYEKQKNICTWEGNINKFVHIYESVFSEAGY